MHTLLLPLPNMQTHACMHTIRNRMGNTNIIIKGVAEKGLEFTVEFLVILDNFL